MQIFMTDGYLNKTEKGYHFFEAKTDKRAMACFTISVRRPYGKKNEDGYYPYDLIPARAYGQTAEFINNNVKHRDALVYKGYFVMDPAVEQADGRTYPAHLVFIVENVEFSASSGNSGNKASVQQQPTSSFSTPKQQSKIVVPF